MNKIIVQALLMFLIFDVKTANFDSMSNYSIMARLRTLVTLQKAVGLDAQGSQEMSALKECLEKRVPESTLLKKRKQKPLSIVVPEVAIRQLQENRRFQIRSIPTGPVERFFPKDKRS